MRISAIVARWQEKWAVLQAGLRQETTPAIIRNLRQDHADVVVLIPA